MAGMAGGSRSASSVTGLVRLRWSAPGSRWQSQERGLRLPLRTLRPSPLCPCLRACLPPARLPAPCRYTEFIVEGGASIHLTGYYMPEFEMGAPPLPPRGWGGSLHGGR